MKAIWRKFSFKPSISIPEFIKQYDHIKQNEKGLRVERLGGRIIGIRQSSKSLTFIDMASNGNQLQIISNANHFNTHQYQSAQGYIKRGNYIGATGIPYKTKLGTLSLLLLNTELLASCHHNIPILNRDDKDMLTDCDTRFSMRFLDFWVNKDKMKYFTIRRDLISLLREYLNKRDFIEVETPILCSYAGGAIARPFKTRSNEYNIDYELRVSPELYLKELIVSGFEKVYEIGKVFRNEGINATHNPEFTTCEFYQVHANYEDLMIMTEDLLKSIIFSMLKSYKIDQIDFSKPFKRIDVMTELNSFFKQNINLSNPELELQMRSLMESNNILSKSEASSLTNKKLFDKAIAHIIEQHCDQPTFVVNHPKLSSPLAKPCECNPLLTERFELFIKGVEYINAYSELSDPFIQASNFKLQKEDNQNGESVGMDQHFVDVLTYGMPPTAGWGLGIDRLCMLLCNVSNIREVILFPGMRKPIK